MEGEVFTPILCPTNGLKGPPAYTMVTVIGALLMLGRSFTYHHAGGFGYAHARNMVLRECRNTYPQQQKVRGFFIDDDMLLLSSSKALAEMMLQADQQGLQMVGAYKTLSGAWAVGEADGEGIPRLLTPELFARYHPWETVEYAGLGFYYGDIPLDYTFHDNPRWLPGEDYNFFDDHRGLMDFRLAPLTIKHLKEAAL